MTAVISKEDAAHRARIAKLAHCIFGDGAKADRWLRKPKRELDGATPLAYLASEAGTRMVEQMLNRIDHGMAP